MSYYVLRVSVGALHTDRNVSVDSVAICKLGRCDLFKHTGLCSRVSHDGVGCLMNLPWK